MIECSGQHFILLLSGYDPRKHLDSELFVFMTLKYNPLNFKVNFIFKYLEFSYYFK